LIFEKAKCLLFILEIFRDSCGVITRDDKKDTPTLLPYFKIFGSWWFSRRKLEYI
jgi:hypothetical protein